MKIVKAVLSVAVISFLASSCQTDQDLRYDLAEKKKIELRAQFEECPNDTDVTYLTDGVWTLHLCSLPFDDEPLAQVQYFKGDSCPSGYTARTDANLYPGGDRDQGWSACATSSMETLQLNWANLERLRFYSTTCPRLHRDIAGAGRLRFCLMR